MSTLEYVMTIGFGILFPGYILFQVWDAVAKDIRMIKELKAEWKKYDEGSVIKLKHDKE